MIEGGSTYVDAGATALDDIDGDITEEITVVNPVNTGAVGSYDVTYNVKDAGGNSATEVVRSVTVEDTTIPVITLNGENKMNAEAGGTFTDPGATVADNVDQDLVVTITGSVDTNKLGDYVLQYTAKDKSDNVATSVTRTITVVDTTAPVITLLGETTLTHEGGTPYTDAGASVTDNLDMNSLPL